MKTNSIEKDVDKLLNIITPQESIKDVLRMVTEKTFPTSKLIAEKTLDLFMTERNTKSIHQITKEIYLRNYTHREIKSMIKFYSSKDGKSILKKISMVATEMAIASKNWSISILEDSKKEIEKIIEEQIKEEIAKEQVKEIIEDPEKTANKRYKFSQKYIAEKGWDSKNLSSEQLMEIRSQEGWKNAQ